MHRLLFEHLPISVLTGLLGWSAGGSWLCVPLALTVGWCIDVDHFFDFSYYWLRCKKNPDWSFIRSGGYFYINGKIFVPLHSWVLTFILLMGLGFLHRIGF
jgi:hypothetical protein